MSPAPGQPVPRTLSFFALSPCLQRNCPSLAAAPRGMWAAQGTMDGSPAIAGEHAVGPGWVNARY